MAPGGCGGGAHPLQAEFWLRHGKNLDRALESFKGALRHELDNPRWLLRIAQVEAGASFVNGMVKSDPRLPFGGTKISGFGRELSHHGIKEFVNIQTVWIK